MFRIAVWVTLVGAAMLLAECEAASPGKRDPRSIWPFASKPEDEPLLSEEQLDMLEKAGLGRQFNLSSRPLWKMHKYHGLELKPVVLETEYVGEDQQVDARGAVHHREEEPVEAATTTTTTTTTTSTTTPEPDLSFLDDLGGLAWMLPEPGTEEDQEKLANAISTEEQRHPGFVDRLWSAMLWLLPNSSWASDGLFGQLFNRAAEQSAENAALQPRQPEEANVEGATIYLPATRGSYVRVIVPSLQSHHQVHVAQEQQPQQQPETPIVAEHHVDLFRQPLLEKAQQPSEPAIVPISGSKSRSHVESWAPHSSYELTVNDHNEVSKPAAPQPPSATLDRRSDEQVQQQEDEPTTTTTAATTTTTTTTTSASSGTTGSVAEEPTPTNHQLADVLKKKVQVTRELVDTAMTEDGKARAKGRLRALQRDYEMRKEQLSYVYPQLRKQIAKIQQARAD